MNSRINCWILLILYLVVHSAALLPSTTTVLTYRHMQCTNMLHKQLTFGTNKIKKPHLVIGALTKRRSENKEEHVTPTNVLIAANVLLFSAAMVFPRLKQQWMKIDYRIAKGETYRLLTSMFMHGGLPHLAMNCYSLYNIGPQANRIFGTPKYLAIYAGAGVLANAFTFLGGTSPYSLGASGSIFGVMGAIGSFYWINRKPLGSRSESALKSIQRTIIMNLFYGMSSTNVDQWAHIGGFGAGAALALCLSPRLGAPRVPIINRNRWVPIMPVKRRPWANLRDALQGRFGSMVNKVANMQSSQFADDSTSVVQYASDGATIKNLNYYEEYGDLME